MNLLTHVPLDLNNPLLKRLRDALVLLYGNHASAQQVANEAGLEAGTFPNLPTMRATWTELLEELARQGKLRRLVEIAAARPIDEQYRQLFATVLEQDQQQPKGDAGTRGDAGTDRRSAPRIYISQHAVEPIAQQALETLITRLEAAGYVVLWDQRRAQGSAWDNLLYTRISNAHAGVILFSKQAVTSEQVRPEVSMLAARQALEASFPLVPVLVDVTLEELPGDLLTPWDLAALFRATPPVTAGSADAVADAVLARLANLITAYPPSADDVARPPATPPETVPSAAASRLLPRHTGSNPFVVGPTVRPDLFYGRRVQRETVRNRIGAISAQCLVVVGLRRSGKSSLLRYVCERIHEFCPAEQRPLVVKLDLQKAAYQTPDGLVDGLRREVEKDVDHSPWLRGLPFGEPDVEDGLAKLRDEGYRLIVLVDEFERLEQRLAEFQGWGSDWRSKASDGLFALVLATARPLAEVYAQCGLDSPFGNIFSETMLGPLEHESWRALVRDGFARGGVTLGEEALALVDDLAGGLPFYVQLAASLLWETDDAETVRALFAEAARPRFEELWRDLRSSERQTLRHAVGLAGVPAPAPALVHTLQGFGLLRSGGQPFSSAWATFVREQP